MWRTTGDRTYSDYVVEQYPDFRLNLDKPAPEGWRDVAAMGLWTYALGSGKSGDAAIVANIRKRTSQAAHAILESTRKKPYHVSLRARDYVWGSNGVAAAYRMELLLANALTPDPKFVETALDNLHYLLGRNAFSLSWVTQVGDNPFRHLHHRPNGADKNTEPWPGLLSGGPNARTMY